MEPYQQRVIDEKIELDKKIEALSVFITTSPIFNGLPRIEKSRLTRQITAMKDYSDVLGRRIGDFKPTTVAIPTNV